MIPNISVQHKLRLAQISLDIQDSQDLWVRHSIAIVISHFYIGISAFLSLKIVRPTEAEAPISTAEIAQPPSKSSEQLVLIA
jgi:hypothetical protein